MNHNSWKMKNTLKHLGIALHYWKQAAFVCVKEGNYASLRTF